LTYDRQHCAFLEKLIRQPLYAAIDTIRIRHGRYPSANGMPLSKSECCELYAKEFPEIDKACFLSMIVRKRNKYKQFLGERYKRSVEEYVQLLEEINSLYPVALDVIEANHELLVNGSIKPFRI